MENKLNQENRPQMCNTCTDLLRNIFRSVSICCPFFHTIAAECKGGKENNHEEKNTATEKALSSVVVGLQFSSRPEGGSRARSPRAHSFHHRSCPHCVGNVEVGEHHRGIGSFFSKMCHSLL